MKSTVEQLSPTRVRISIEVPFDELKPSFDRAYRKLAEQVRVPGFRPGKAPARVLESRLGRGVVLDEVVNEAIPVKYLEAVDGGEVRAMGRPDIEVTKLEDGATLAFSAEVDIRPEFTVPPFGELAVTVPRVEVTDDEVDRQVDDLRARFGTLKGVERPARQGDFVVLDLSAAVDGEVIEEARTSGLSYEVGSGRLVAGADDALIGAEAGQTKTFTTPLAAGPHAGKDAEVSLTVQSIKERELPELDDEFAQLASEFDTLDELRADMRDRFQRVKTMQHAVAAREKVLAALLEAVEMPMPEAVLKAEMDARTHDAMHNFNDDDALFAKWLDDQGQTREEFDAAIREGAEKAIKTQLVLDAIAESRNVTVEDSDLTERIVYQAQRLGVTPDEFVRHAQETGQLGAIYAEVRRGKALELVVAEVSATDEAGEAVDLVGSEEEAATQETPEPAAEDTSAAE